MNPFALFEFEPAFSLDQSALSARYLALQKTFHPDNFAHLSAQEQRVAMQKSTEINDAFKMLKDPILRAEALIALKTGNQQDAEQKSSHDVAFLMQQMALREELEQIEGVRDEGNLLDFSKQVEAENHETLTALEVALNAEQWAAAENLCDKLRFYKKLMLEIERVEDSFFA